MPSIARTCCSVAPLAVALGTALYAADAQAGPNDNSASKPWSLHAGLGPVVNFRGGGLLGRFTFDMEYHFKGGDVGPALGFYAAANFNAWSGGLNIGPLFNWDFRIYEKDNVKLYIGPLAATGYGFHSGWYGRYGGPRRRGPGPAYLAHFWFFYVSPHFRVLWNDTIGMFARFAGFEVWAGNFGATGHFSFIAGLAAAF
jgi:hypothetical protein